MYKFILQPRNNKTLIISIKIYKLFNILILPYGRKKNYYDFCPIRVVTFTYKIHTLDVTIIMEHRMTFFSVIKK